jgi:hypothetical protein
MRIAALLVLAPMLGACPTPPPAPPPVNTSWVGTWEGELVNIPTPPGFKPVQVKLEIGEFPAADNTCSTWRKTFAEDGVVRQVKDYKLCRGQGEQDLYVDEGDGTKLTTRWIGDVLVSPFKYDNILLITSTRLRGEVLEEEILVVTDKPAIQGVQPLLPRSIQRSEMRRAASAQ